MATLPSFAPRYQDELTYSIVRPASTASVARMARTMKKSRRMRCARWVSARPSSRTSTTTTVTLSWPPAASASLTSESAACCGVAVETAMASIRESSTMPDRPSEQMITRSPAEMLSVKWSAYMSGSEPSARVITERDGCTRASSAVISPASTSSST